MMVAAIATDVIVIMLFGTIIMVVGWEIIKAYIKIKKYLKARGKNEQM